MRKWVVNLLSAVLIVVLLVGLGYRVALVSTIPNPVQNLIPSLGLSSLELGGGGRGAGAPAKGDGGAADPPPPAARRSGPQDGGGGRTPSAPSGSGGGARTPSAPSGSGPPRMDSAPPPPPPNTQKVIFFCCLADDHPVPVPTPAAGGHPALALCPVARERSSSPQHAKGSFFSLPCR
jgi:hypothetical protein